MSIAIVTGATGFLGTELIKLLSLHNYKVYAVVRNEKSNIQKLKNLRGVQIVTCEMKNLNLICNFIPETADIFYHLAWSGSTGPDRGNYEMQLENIKWTLDAVHAAQKLGCKRFVGAGTLAEHDVVAYTPLDGSTPNRVSCYGVAKLSAHYMSKAECCSVGIEHLWAYISNTYGPGNYTSNFVNFAIKTMLSGQPAKFTSGEQFYDFVHVCDTVQGLECIGELGEKNCAYYIGSNGAKRLKEFIMQIRDAIDPSIPLSLGEIPFNGVSHNRTVFDCSKLMLKTGYSPKVSFEEGIQDTVKWVKEQLEGGKL